MALLYLAGVISDKPACTIHTAAVRGFCSRMRNFLSLSVVWIDMYHTMLYSGKFLLDRRVYALRDIMALFQ